MKKIEKNWFFIGTPEQYSPEKPDRVRILINPEFTGLIKRNEQVHYLYRYVLKLSKIQRLGFWKDGNNHYISIKKDKVNDLVNFLEMNKDVIQKLSEKVEKNEEKTSKEYKPPRITL